MPIVYNSIVGGIGPVVTLTTSDSLIIGQSGVTFSTDSAAIVGAGNQMSVLVAGLISSQTNDAINFSTGDGSQTGIRITIANTGHLQANDDGIEINGVDAVIDNHGSIDGNYGMFIGSSSQASTTKVFNTGTIHGQITALYAAYYATSSFNLVNEGVIAGRSNSLLGGNLVDTIDNSGVMRGNMNLRGGNDIYIGTYGRLIGNLFGGDGDDSFWVGAGSETIDGGNGTDTLDFTKTSGIQVALDGSFANTGLATGDSYSNIEALKGSATGADRFAGNALVNFLYGYGGDDSLSGGAGNDLIAGGVGKDLLLGGTGNDRFYFHSLSDAGDFINDFSNLAGNNDDLRFKGSAFGALPAGTLAAAKFWSNTTGLAHDADDRFIFRTTDKTLWYDANGTAAGGPVLIADLQNTAPNLTAGDIIIF